eukprot:TRINITY_DN1625_c0_g1_i1.p1 TRINITY_DN1625_c0_g1~~TRINITY_DN1625_c0_g1_i1.p1  ORF type:complete len:362 (+),score=73.78 TRINITY_DN1625_c0_g1_i1:85-1170(+)
MIASVGAIFLESDVQMIDVHADMTVEELKEEVCSREQAKPSYFEVMLSGDVLDSRKKVMDGAVDADTVFEISLSRQGKAVYLLGRETTRTEFEELLQDLDADVFEPGNLQSFLDAGDIDANTSVDGKEPTPIHIAIFRTNVRAIKALSTIRGFDINNHASDAELTPLCAACYTDCIQTVEAVLAIPKVCMGKVSSDSVHAPLAIACERGNLQIVEALLNQPSIDVNERVPLLAAVSNHLIDAVKLLLSHKDINVNTALGLRLPLQEACSKGYVDIVKLLLEHPTTDINKKIGSCSPLFMASSRGRLPVVLYLLEYPGLEIPDAGVPNMDPAIKSASKGYKRVSEAIRESKVYREYLERNRV